MVNLTFKNLKFVAIKGESFMHGLEHRIISGDVLQVDYSKTSFSIEKPCENDNFSPIIELVKFDDAKEQAKYQE